MHKPVSSYKALRRIKIVETRYGRTIEAWTYTDDSTPLLEDKDKKEKEPSFLHKAAVAISLFGWGVCGIAVGNLIFIHY